MAAGTRRGKRKFKTAPAGDNGRGRPNVSTFDFKTADHGYQILLDFIEHCRAEVHPKLSKSAILRAIVKEAMSDDMLKMRVVSWLKRLQDGTAQR